MPKSRRQKDNDKFYNVFFGGESSSNSLERDRSKRESEGYRTAFTTPDGTMLLYPQTGLDFDDLNTSVLPPHNPRNGTRDNVVFQLKSELVRSPSQPPRHIFDEGQPTRLIEIFKQRNVVFAGKDIAQDLELIYQRAGLSYEEFRELRIIETTRVYKFSHALAKGGNKLHAWLDGKEVGLFPEISLKDFCQFVNSKMIIDKTPTHRNHYANFNDKGGRPIREKDIRYAAGDTLFLLRRLSTSRHKPASILISSPAPSRNRMSPKTMALLAPWKSSARLAIDPTQKLRICPPGI